MMEQLRINPRIVVVAVVAVALLAVAVIFVMQWLSATDEQTIIVKESGVDPALAKRLVQLGEMIRNLRQHGLEEGISTRLLVYAAKLMVDGVSPAAACNAAVIRAMSDDSEMQEAISEIVTGIF